MKYIIISFSLLLISCTSKRFEVADDESISYTKKMALQQYHISKVMFDIGDKEGKWGREAISELDETKRIIAELYTAMGNDSMFPKMKKELLDNCKVIDIDTDISNLLYPDETKLSLAELAIYLKYRGHAYLSLTQFDQIKMFNFKTDSGYLIGVAGGRSNQRPVITNGEKTIKFNDPFFITLSPEEISDLGGKAWLTFPTHLGDTSVLMNFDY